MSTVQPPTDWQAAQASETCICDHSGPETCEKCGGKNGVPGIPPCLRCRMRGGVPTAEVIEATEPRQLPPPDPAVQRIIDNAGLYDDTV